MRAKFIAIFTKEEKAENFFEYLSTMGRRSFNGRHELYIRNLCLESGTEHFTVAGDYVLGDSHELDYWCSVDRKVLLRGAFLFDDCSLPEVRCYYQTNLKVRYGLIEYQADIYDLETDTYLYEDIEVPKEIIDIALPYFLDN